MTVDSRDTEYAQLCGQTGSQTPENLNTRELRNIEKRKLEYERNTSRYAAGFQVLFLHVHMLSCFSEIFDVPWRCPGYQALVLSIATTRYITQDGGILHTHTFSRPRTHTHARTCAHTYVPTRRPHFICHSRSGRRA